MRFPQKTYEQMLEGVNELDDCKFRRKFNRIKTFTDIDKKNRWFGYYQHVGEIMGLWTKSWVIEQVTKEREGGQEFFQGSGNGF